MTCPKCKGMMNFLKVDTFFLGLLELLSLEKKPIDKVDFFKDNKIVLHTDDEKQIVKTYGDLFQSY